MIGTVFRIGFMRLRNNPLELLLVFVVPIVFFSIFAMIFGKGIGSGQTGAVKVLLVDEDDTDISRRLIATLRADAGLTDVSTKAALAPDRVDVANGPLNRDRALEQVRNGRAKVAIVLVSGFGEDLQFSDDPRVVLLADTSDEIAPKLAEAVVRKALGQETGIIQRDRAKRRIALLPPKLQERFRGLADEPEPSMREGLVVVEAVLASDKVNPRISMYAAGIAVLFVLFSATGSAGTLLEEHEAGTLERLLSSQVSVTQLLAGKWLFVAAIGLLQVIVMFVWARLVFGVELFSHLPGFFAMAISTSSAAASLAILLATVCRTRSQLNGVAMIVVLTMSALGGSMVPRYIMSESMQRFGYITFNTWALEGFEKVFWRNQPVTALWPEIGVLLGASVVMLVAARVFARRWEP